MTTTTTAGFTEDQRAFAELAAKMFDSFPRPASAGDPDVAHMCSALADIGLPLLMLPADDGGGGMDEIDVVLILEEAGYADLPISVAETVGVVAPMLARYGTDEQKARWLPDFAAGTALGTTWCPDGGLGSRTGADVVLAERDGIVHVVDLPADEPGEQIQIGPDSALRDPWASAAELRARAAWVSSALLNGVSRRLLDLSIEHARSRTQFGVPIGSFQAVKHMLAETAAAVEAARPSSWAAAKVLGHHAHDAAIACGVAKAVASNAGRIANDHALQVHGGIGFTREHPLHAWLLYGHELESRWGAADRHHADLGQFAAECDSLITTFLP